MKETETKKTVPSWCLVCCKAREVKKLDSTGVSTTGSVWEQQRAAHFCRMRSGFLKVGGGTGMPNDRLVL
jgi:hypothetical protein